MTDRNLKQARGMCKYKPLIGCMACFLLLASFLSCATSPAKNTANLPSALVLPVEPVVTLGPGDVIDVKFRYWPELDESQTIRPDGKISLQIVDEVHVAGLTPQQLDQHLTKLYESKLKQPDITVVVRSLANQRVYVGGEVETPGLIDLQGHLTPLQAIINSGGFLDTAKPEDTIVIRKGADNRPVPIRVDLKEMFDGKSNGAVFELRPSDIVYVPKSSIGNINQFMRQYIQDMLLFRGWGFNLW